MVCRSTDKYKHYLASQVVKVCHTQGNKLMSLKYKIADAIDEKIETVIDEYINDEVDQFMEDAVKIIISSGTRQPGHKNDDFIVYPFIYEMKTDINPKKAIHSPKTVYLTDMFNELIEDCEGGKESLMEVQARWKLMKQRVGLAISKAIYKSDHD